MAKKKLLTFSITCLVLAAGVWFGRPIYRAQKEKKFAAQANAAFAKAEYRKALLNAQQVLVLNSNNLPACRVMAELSDLSRSPLAMVWRRRIAEIEPTVSNRIVFASCALRYEQPPFPIASQLVKELGDTAQNEIAFHLVAAQLALKQTRIAESEEHFEEAVRLEPTNDLHRVNLAVVRMESRDTNVSARAHADLERLQSSAAWGVQARRALLMHHLAHRQFAEAERFSTALLSEPKCTFADKLEHLTVLRSARSPQFEAFAAELQHDAATNVFTSADLVTRLTELGAASNAIVWVKSLPAAMQNEPPLPMALASSYFALGRWRELEDSLNPQQWKERDFIRKALMAFAVSKQKETSVAALHWKDSVQLASARPELLGTLAQMAWSWGWTNEAEAVLWRTVKDFPAERWPVEALQNSYVQTRNTRGLYEINTLMLDRQPTNVLAQNNWATLAFLLDTNLTKAHQLAREVYQHDTNNFGFVSTYAYSLHLQGRTAEALKVIETLQPAELENPSVASYYGVVLAAAGQSEKARRYLAKADGAPILPEESKLVLEARKKL